MNLSWLAAPLLRKRLLRVIHRRLVSVPRRDRLVVALGALSRDASTLLDVGAGDGVVGAGVAELLGASVEGADSMPNPTAPFPVARIEGDHLPFADRSFDVVLLSDVLHHTCAPDLLLAEALRVAKKAVVLKDHFAFGRWSHGILLALDLIGNRPYGVDVRGEYATPEAWLARFERARARVDELLWPLHVHSPAIRMFTRSEHQFAARLVLEGNDA